MTRSRLSTKAVLLATGIGLSMAAFVGSQPAAAQSYSYTCPSDFTYDPTYGCVSQSNEDYGDYGYGYPYYGAYYAPGYYGYRGYYGYARAPYWRYRHHVRHYRYY